MRYMSQNLANDLPDKFGSSDEDEDDEEVVGWMGESGEFEPRARNSEGVEDEEEHVRKFGRRGLFNERWESDFHHENDDQYEFRGIGAGLSAEEHDLIVPRFLTLSADLDRVRMMRTPTRACQGLGPVKVIRKRKKWQLWLVYRRQ